MGETGGITYRVFEEAPDLLKSLKVPFRRLASGNATKGCQVLPTSQDIIAVAKEMI